MLHVGLTSRRAVIIEVKMPAVEWLEALGLMTDRLVFLTLVLTTVVVEAEEVMEDHNERQSCVEDCSFYPTLPEPVNTIIKKYHKPCTCTVKYTLTSHVHVWSVVFTCASAFACVEASLSIFTSVLSSV